LIKKLFFLIFLNISVLTMYTNTNASELNSVKISTLTSEDASSNTKSIECREHEWEYCTRTTGSIVYYNYRCFYCGAYRYSPWKRK
jgi:hypothetical protein